MQRRIFTLQRLACGLALCGLVLCGSPAAADQADRREFPAVPILIDPGHGGLDDGVDPGSSPLPEKDLVLAISLMLRDQLRAAGVPVAMVRTQDRYVAISQRVAFANALFFRPDNSPAAGRMLSIHLNSNRQNPNLTRVEVRVPFHRPEAWPLGLALYAELSALTGGGYGFVEAGHPAGVHPADLAVTARTYPQGYNILTESMFLTNADHAARLIDPAFQRELAAAHLRGLRAGLGR